MDIISSIFMMIGKNLFLFRLKMWKFYGIFFTFIDCWWLFDSIYEWILITFLLRAFAFHSTKWLIIFTWNFRVSIKICKLAILFSIFNIFQPQKDFIWWKFDAFPTTSLISIYYNEIVWNTIKILNCFIFIFIHT